MSLTDKIKKYMILGVIFLLALFGLKHCRKIQDTQDTAITSPVLKPDDKEKIIIDPIKHTVTRITNKGTTVTNLPDRPVSITEGKDGLITIHSRTWGKELRPFIGAGVDLSPAARLHLGADLFYWHKLDLGLGVGVNPVAIKNTTLNLNVSYNFYNNTSIALSIDNRKVPGLFLKVRF